MKKRFTITYDIVTQESSENGDVEHSGFLDENFDYERNGQYRHAEGITHAAFTLREVFEFLTSDYPGEHVRESVECDSCPWHVGNPPRWINFSGGWNMEGESLSFSLHPDKRGGITGASMCRIARLFSAYGEGGNGKLRRLERITLHGVTPGAYDTETLSAWVKEHANIQWYGCTLRGDGSRAAFLDVCLESLTCNPRLAETFPQPVTA